MRHGRAWNQSSKLCKPIWSSLRWACLAKKPGHNGSNKDNPDCGWELVEALMFGRVPKKEHPTGCVGCKSSGFIDSSKNQADGNACWRYRPSFGRLSKLAEESAETNGCLPDKGKQQEKHRDQGKDVDQRRKGLIGLGQLSHQIEGKGGHP